MTEAHRNTIIGINLAKMLAEHDYRIFNIDTAYKFGKQVGIKDSYLVQCLHYLHKQGWIWQLKRGLYALAPIMTSGKSAHEYEIAMSLVTPSAISFWSAIHFHQLTDQLPHKVFVLTPNIGPKGNESKIHGVLYQFVTTKKGHYFGIEKVYINDAPINVTDLERTILDAIMKPKYCGGIAEVFAVVRNATSNKTFSLDKLLDYAVRIGNSACRRTGWILENIASIPKSKLKRIIQPNIGYIKLDPSGVLKGKCDKQWGIIQNI